MGLFEKLRGELVDIVEWIDDDRHTLVWRFPRYQNEIKNGAKLVVRPGQKVIFVDQGRIADVFEPGFYTLDTANLPVLSTLRGWKYGFDSPFKCEVYFVSTRQVTDLKWGTPNPIMLRDADFGPLRIRAFGTYALQARDPKILLEQLVGTDGIFETDELRELMRSFIISSFADVLGEAKIPALDLAARYGEISEALRLKVESRIQKDYGIDLPQLIIVNISLPEEVEKALDTRSSMGVIGDLGRFQQYQMGQAMTAAANNPAGGGAAEGMGLGVGLAMAHQMMQGGAGGVGALGAPSPAGTAPAGAAVPPPLPAAPSWFLAQQGQTFGPFLPAQLAQQAAAGQLTPDTLVWSAGMAGWVAAGQLPQLASLFAQTPPPPPPTP
jgi:membrane protease subunit (stomatin/prohibitin family)